LRLSKISFNASPEIRTTGHDSVGFNDEALGRLAVLTVWPGAAMYADFVNGTLMGQQQISLGY
jgi:hypothetical protein